MATVPVGTANDHRWHTLDAADVVDALAVDPSSGLSDSVAAERLDTFGENAFIFDRGPSAGSILVRQFTSFLTILLVVAAAASGLLLGEWIDAIAIAAIVLLNAAIGFTQEYRAARALAALRQLTGPVAHVLRDRRELQIAGTDVVPGDVLVLDTGDRIVADARLLDIRDLEVDESSLTGESLPVEKTGGGLLGSPRSATSSGWCSVGPRSLGVVAGRSS